MTIGMTTKHIYLLHIVGDVEPHLHGQYTDEDARDIWAKRIRAKEGDDGGLYPVTLEINVEYGKVTHSLDVDSYSGAFFDE